MGDDRGGDMHATGFTDREQNRMKIRPGRLLCLKCLNGGGFLPFMDKEGLKGKLEKIKKDPQTHIELETSFDEMGARTGMFFDQDVTERKRDLDVLQLLGLSPGDTRIARDLYDVIGERIKDVYKICAYGGNHSAKWPPCPLSREDCFGKGGEGLNRLNTKEEMSCLKEISRKEIEAADRIFIRAHHLLCVFCYISADYPGDRYLPLAEDNLYEVWMKMRENPEIPVTLIEGAEDCMVCPPCHGFDRERKLCFLGCHLRDRKKDADTFQKLGLLPGDTLPARELIALIYDRIPDNSDICAYEYQTVPQWKSCGGSERYLKGLKKGFFGPHGEGKA